MALARKRHPAQQRHMRPAAELEIYTFTIWTYAIVGKYGPVFGTSLPLYPPPRFLSYGYQLWFCPGMAKVDKVSSILFICLLNLEIDIRFLHDDT